MPADAVLATQAHAEKTKKETFGEVTVLEHMNNGSSDAVFNLLCKVYNTLSPTFD